LTCGYTCVSDKCSLLYLHVVFDGLGELLLVLVRVLQERVLQQLAGIGPIRCVLHQTLLHKVAEFVGPAAVYRGGILLYYIENHSALWLINVRGVAFCHLHRENSERPNVYFGRVGAFSTNQLGGHPADCAHLALPACFLLSQLAGISEICKLDLSVATHEQIIRFDVTMDNVLLVQEVQTLKRLFQHILDDIFAV